MNLVGLISSIAVLLPFMVINKSLIQDNNIRLLLLFVLANLLFQSILTITSIQGINNILIYNISLPVCLFFSFLYFKNSFPKYKGWIKFLFIITLITLIFSYANSHKISEFNPISSFLLSLNYLGFGLISLISMYDDKDYYLELKGKFWVTVAFFIYGGSQLMLNGFLKFLVPNKELFTSLYEIHHIFTIIFYVLIAYGLWLNRFKQQQL